METVGNVLQSLSTAIPWERAAGWDAVGLQVGDPGAGVGRVGVCHDVTETTLTAAGAAGVDLLVSYHPLLFERSRAFVAGAGSTGLAFRAARDGIAVASAHTAFDVVPGGAADALAGALDLEQVTGFGPLWPAGSVKVVTFVPADAVTRVADAMADAGAGRIGQYTGCSFRSEGMGVFTAAPSATPAVGEPGATTEVAELRLEMVAPAGRVDTVIAALVGAHPYEEPAYDVVDRRGDAGFVGRVGTWHGTLGDLAALAAERLGGVIRTAGTSAGRIRSVAVVPGSGASLLAAAGSAGADAIVTGDVKHHDARVAVAAGTSIVDPGHAATERPGVGRLYAAVAAVWSDAVDLTAVDADPWNE